ncbi:MAG: SAM-dependent methyltransferase [Proteobacteria bacterium]|nr:SAM-dependent methyltransferase [Pseudomonadota bacterium]
MSELKTIDRLAAFEPLPVSADLQAYVRDHESADVPGLLLGKSSTGIDKRRAAQQILSRRKARRKLPDWYANESVWFPDQKYLEQASSTCTAAYKAGLVGGERVVDLTGGTGVDLVALAANFEHAVYVERDPLLCSIFAHNVRALKLSNIDIVNSDAQTYLKDHAGSALFYVDPSRRDRADKRVIGLRDCDPDIHSLVETLAGRASRVMVKASPMLDLKLAIDQLGSVEAVPVVSVDNECKELLIFLNGQDTEIKTGSVDVFCVNLSSTSIQVLHLILDDEAISPGEFTDPLAYLYEPNAAIMKAGGFNCVARRFGAGKIAPNTHLYTSARLIPDFPGRMFKVDHLNVTKPDRFLTDRRANVISRNHPLNGEQLKERYRLKDGGDAFVVGYADNRNKPRLLIAHRVEYCAPTS